jgi:hypothetical protein
LVPEASDTLIFATDPESAVAKSLAEHVPVWAVGLVTAAVPVPEVLATNGESVFRSKFVAVTTVPVSVLVGAATPVRQVAAMAAFAEPKRRLLETSNPRLPIVPSFLKLLIA